MMFHCAQQVNALERRVGQLVFDVMRCTPPGGMVCLTGITWRRSLNIDLCPLNRDMVLAHDLVCGSVNANRPHYEAAAQVPAWADHRWLRLLTRLVPLAHAVHEQANDATTVVEFPSDLT
jgi:hypothetical protein